MPDTTEDIVRNFFTLYPRRAYPKNQILVFADENPEHIFYIVSGKVRKYDTSYKGDEVIVNIFKPLAFFPVSWAINRSHNSFYYKTEEATVLHVVPADDAAAFLRSHPEVMYDLLGRIYRGLDGLLGRVVHLMSGSAKSRLMYELIIECRRFGAMQADGGYTISLSEVDIAARAGLTRETVSREMGKLKAKRMVVAGKGGLCIPDVSALERAIGGHI